MARLNLDALPGMQARAVWEARRRVRAFARRHGWAGFVMVGAVLLGLLSGIGYLRAAIAARGLEAQRVELGRHPAVAVVDTRTRLQAFDDYLLVHEEIPAVLQALIASAKGEGLRLTRGEYSPDVDAAGGFLRYRMTFPVKGDAEAIYRFMLTALRTHRTLALETVEFKRETIGSRAVEARIQWSLLTRLPETGRTEARGDAPGQRVGGGS